MDCIIVYRNPSNRKIGVVTISAEDDAAMVFPDFDAAVALTQTHPLLKSVDWQIVELDEL